MFLRSFPWPPADFFFSQVDIFSIGCLIHYVLTGLHPFGKPYEQQHRILLSQSQLKTIREKDVEAHDLIAKCISKLPTER